MKQPSYDTIRSGEDNFFQIGSIEWNWKSMILHMWLATAWTRTTASCVCALRSISFNVHHIICLYLLSSGGNDSVHRRARALHFSRKVIDRARMPVFDMHECWFNYSELRSIAKLLK